MGFQLLLVGCRSKDADRIVNTSQNYDMCVAHGFCDTEDEVCTHRDIADFPRCGLHTVVKPKWGLTKRELNSEATKHQPHGVHQPQVAQPPYLYL